MIIISAFFVFIYCKYKFIPSFIKLTNKDKSTTDTVIQNEKTETQIMDYLDN